MIIEQAILRGDDAVLGLNDSLDLAALAAAYRNGGLTPTEMVTGVLDRIARRGDDKVWIHLLPREELLAMAKALEGAGPAGKPLYGVPFAIKDNIDLARSSDDRGLSRLCLYARQVGDGRAPLD